MLHRRDILKVAAGSLVVPACGKDFVDVCGTSRDFDVVLDALHATDPEFEGGLSNHGPMASQVLHEQGRDDRMCEWIGGYIGQLDSLPDAQPLTTAEQTSALGDVGKRAAWIATYAESLATGDVATVLASQWPILLPAYAAAAFHGPLRTGHALRSLAELDSPTRRREVAHGLGHWASRYRTLPGTSGSQPITGLDLVAALDQLTVLPASDQQSGGFVHERLAKIDRLPTFADEIARVDLAALSVEESLSALAAAAARLYIADSNRSDLGYLHAVDGTSIFRSLARAMDPDTQLVGLSYAFQAVAALHATHASAPGVPQATYPSARAPAELLDAAAHSNDEHTIKLVAALVLEHSIDPRPEFLAAAELRLRG